MFDQDKIVDGLGAAEHLDSIRIGRQEPEVSAEAEAKFARETVGYAEDEIADIQLAAAAGIYGSDARDYFDLAARRDAEDEDEEDDREDASEADRRRAFRRGRERVRQARETGRRNFGATLAPADDGLVALAGALNVPPIHQGGGSASRLNVPRITGARPAASRLKAPRISSGRPGGAGRLNTPRISTGRSTGGGRLNTPRISTRGRPSTGRLNIPRISTRGGGGQGGARRTSSNDRNDSGHFEVHPVDKYTDLEQYLREHGIHQEAINDVVTRPHKGQLHRQQPKPSKTSWHSGR